MRDIGVMCGIARWKLEKMWNAAFCWSEKIREKSEKFNGIEIKKESKNYYSLFMYFAFLFY